MGFRLEASRRAKALLGSRWGAFAALGLLSGALLVTGMWIQDRSSPSLRPVLEASVASRGPFTIWILFQRMDCVESRWKIEGWNEVARSGTIRVAGWALDSGEGWPARADPLDRLDVSFPVRSGPSRALARGLNALGVPTTPAVLVVDAGGRLRRVVPSDRLRSREDIQRIVASLEAVDA